MHAALRAGCSICVAIHKHYTAMQCIVVRLPACWHHMVRATSTSMHASHVKALVSSTHQANTSVQQTPVLKALQA